MGHEGRSWLDRCRLYRDRLIASPRVQRWALAARLAERWTKLASLELRELVRSLVQQIKIGEAQILVWLNRTAIVSSVMPNAPPKPTDSVEPFVLSIPASLRRAGKGVRLVIGNGAAKAIDDGLASLIARAIATRNMFLAGRDDSIDAMASRDMCVGTVLTWSTSPRRASRRSSSRPTSAPSWV